MALRIYSESRPIGTSASLIVSFIPALTLAIKMKFGGVCDVGGSGVITGQGEDMVAGEVVNISPSTEFRTFDGKPVYDLIELYGVADVATTVRVTKIAYPE